MIQLCSKYLPWTIWCHAVCCLHMVSHCGNALLSFPVWSSQCKSICPHLARHRETACLKDEEVTALYLQFWKRWQPFWLTTQQEIPHTISRGPQKACLDMEKWQDFGHIFQKYTWHPLQTNTHTHAHYAHRDTKERERCVWIYRGHTDFHSVHKQAVSITIGTCCLHISP